MRSILAAVLIGFSVSVSALSMVDATGRRSGQFFPHSLVNGTLIIPTVAVGFVQLWLEGTGETDARGNPLPNLNPKLRYQVFFTGPNCTGEAWIQEITDTWVTEVIPINGEGFTVDAVTRQESINSAHLLFVPRQASLDNS